MRLMVFFDLPVKTAEERGNANRFRRYLQKDGFDMLQLSVYARICRGQDMADKHCTRILESLPPAGCVRVMQVTEQQYARMQILISPPKKREKQGTVQLLLF